MGYKKGEFTLFFSQPMIRSRFLAMSHWIDRVFGVAMMALGLKVLFGKTN